MRKWLTALLLVIVMLCATTAALAAEAMDISSECTFKVCYSGIRATQMTDKKFTSKLWTSKKMKNPWVEITAPSAFPMQGLYICFADMPESWEIQIADESGDWMSSIPGDTRFLHTWVQFPEPAQHVRIMVTQEKPYELKIHEIYVFGEGDIPDWVQRWEPTHEKADILFLATHPDDDLIFFGGAIPTYAAEQGRKVVVAYLTVSNTTRQSELLNGLWSMGVRNYPIWGNFRDHYDKDLKAAYKTAGGQTKAEAWLTEIYRKYKPEVVVSQDVNGEYGHKQHVMIADLAQNCIDIAAQDYAVEETNDAFLDSYLAYGPWQVKKLYLHLWPENQITFDWSVPLKSMGGKTGMELAIAAYEYHITQHTSGYSVAETGVEYDNRVFGLVRSTVGEDVRKDDFLENIYDSVGSYEEIPATPQPTPAPTPEPAYVSRMPQLNEAGYIDEGEYIYSSEDEGLWIYVSQTAKIVIERKQNTDPSHPLTWFEAELWCDIENGEALRTVWKNPDADIKTRVSSKSHDLIYNTATENQAVFAMNTDYFTYRKVSKSAPKMGVVIRDGEIIYDNPYTESELNKWLFPNLDMLAIYPDGNMTVHHSYEMTAQEFIDAGATTVYSFGPYLIKDGQLSEKAYTSAESNQPRCALGMVEPGHYVVILAEGRLKRSGGLDIEYLAKLMRNKGCQVAMNMDGGQTAVICFMGKQLNQIGVYDGKTTPRKTCEILTLGTSAQVGVYEVQ